jgi:hypothetical protein
MVKVSAMILQPPSRQFQGKLSATSGALDDGTIVALSFAAAPPRAQAATAIAARTTLSTWNRTEPPSQGASPLRADAPPLPPVAELPTYEEICTTPAKVWHKHLNNRNEPLKLCVCGHPSRLQRGA